MAPDMNEYRRLMRRFSMGERATAEALQQAVPNHLQPEEHPVLIVDHVTSPAAGLRAGTLVMTSERLLMFPGRRSLNASSSPHLSVSLDDVRLGTGGKFFARSLVVLDRSDKELAVINSNSSDESDDVISSVEQAVLGPTRTRSGDRGDLIALIGCLYLGGYGTSLVSQSAYHVVFREDQFVVRDAADFGDERFAQPFAGVREIGLEGPGAVTTGGRFIGGGFGLGGALEGAAVATALNALTTRTKIKTIVRITCDKAELFFHYDKDTPDNLRIVLSPILARLDKSPLREAPASADDALSGLERLAALHAQGHLSEEEFQLGKARLLGGL